METFVMHFAGVKYVVDAKPRPICYLESWARDHCLHLPIVGGR